MLEIAKTGATVFFLNRNAVQAERPHLRPQITGKNVVAIDRVGARRDPILRKVLHGFPQHVDIGTKPEIESRPCIGNHASPPLARPLRRRWRLYKLFVTLSAPRRTAVWACHPAVPFPRAHRSSSPARALQRGSPASRRSPQAATGPAGARFQLPQRAPTDRARGQAPPSPG